MSLQTGRTADSVDFVCAEMWTNGEESVCKYGSTERRRKTPETWKTVDIFAIPVLNFSFFNDNKYVCNYPSFELRRTVANECLNETTEVVEDIKRPHSEHGDSSTHSSVFTGHFSSTLF